MEKLRNVRQLEALARAHTLLALMVWPSPASEEHCLVAYTLLKRIWQVRGGGVVAAQDALEASPRQPHRRLP